MLTGEYLVLDGAKSLAPPTRYGQSLRLETQHRLTDQWISWTARNPDGSPWLEASFNSEKELRNSAKNATDLHSKLAKILCWILDNSTSIKHEEEYTFISDLEFDRDWGLGSSSTLIANLSKMFDLDAFAMAADTIGGSCYDVAVGVEGTAIIYWLKEANNPRSNELQIVDWKPNFSDQIQFLHLNQKRVTDEAVAQYQKRSKPNASQIAEVSSISEMMLVANDLKQFEDLMRQHEQVIAKILGETRVKDRLFSDYKGEIKSLGSWGGDFVMITGDYLKAKDYFSSKGFDTLIPFAEMIK